MLMIYVFIQQVQLRPRYNGQINHMAELIPFVLPRDTHHYLAMDRRAETDRLTLTEADAHCTPF